MKITTFTFGFLCASHLLGGQESTAPESKDLCTLRESWQRARKQATDPIDKKYLEELDTLKNRFTTAGQPDAALAVDQEIKRLADRVEPPAKRADGAPKPQATKERYSFAVVMDPHTWEEANWTCKKMGGQLAWFTNRTELECLKKFSSGDNTLEAWVGGSRTPKPPGNWTWPDGSRVPTDIVNLIGSQDVPGRSVLCVTLSTAALKADPGGTNKKIFVCKLPR
jgi:hypothetical protein